MFGFPGFPGGRQMGFEAHYRCMPVAFIDKQSAEFGDKVILPSSALDRLASLHIEYPMLFKVESASSARHTHCGVLEFIAEEGVVYMPHWMMQNLLLQVGDMVKLKNVALPKGTFVKLQPVTSDFLDISNPKAVGQCDESDVGPQNVWGHSPHHDKHTPPPRTTSLCAACYVVVNYNNKNYEIEVKEAKPGPAISVVETDCQVDFEAPKDYKEPEKVFRTPAAGAAAKAESSANKPSGSGGAEGSKAGTDAAPEPEPEPAEPKFLAFADKPSGSSGAEGSKAGTAAAPEPDAEPEEPKFLAFAGAAKRLDGKAPTLVSAPVPVDLHGPSRTLNMSNMPAPPSTIDKPAASSSSAGGQKAGTFVSTGNRLKDKILKEKIESGKMPPPPAPEPAKEEGSSFKAFMPISN
eukprot:gene29337-8891_t